MDRKDRTTMWLFKLICVFILAKSTMNACNSWASWSSCSRSCGGGVRTRRCSNGSTEFQSCNTYCFYGYPYSGDCHCSAWRPGRCCQGCLDTVIAYCKPGMFECGGSPDGIRCTDCYLPYKPAGFSKGCGSTNPYTFTGDSTNQSAEGQAFVPLQILQVGIANLKDDLGDGAMCDPKAIHQSVATVSDVSTKTMQRKQRGCSQLCKVISGSTQCTCRAGYQLSSDEYSCIDIDECFNARCGQQCVNTDGSVKCACDSGYRLNQDRFTCDDIDECQLGNDGCAHVCENIPGSYKCYCNNGYALHDDAHQCQDIDECEADVPTCSQICTNTKGTYHCECVEGFYLDNDATTCIRTESTSRHPETPKITTEVIPSTTRSLHSETVVVLTNVTTLDVTTTYGFSSSGSTTQKKAFPISNDGIAEQSRHTNSEKSSAVGVGVGVSICILFLVGGALVMVVLKRRGILHCNRKAGNNKPSENEPVFTENMDYGTSNEDNIAQHNYFILEKCGQSISNNAEYYNESNDANVMDDYNTIHETEEPYAHVNVENCDYDHTTNALTPGSEARKTENVYNKLKIDRPGDNVNEQRHGKSVVRISEDDYDTISAVVTHGKDDVSDYNHISHTAHAAGVTGDNIKGDKEGEYDAVNSMTFKVAQSNDSDYAHVNKDQIK